MLLLAAPASMAATADPREVVARLQTALTSPAGDFEGRVEALEPVILDTHDMDGIARMSIGRHWEALGAEQRRQLVGTLSRLSIATYARRFAGDAARFSEPRVRDQGERRATVTCTLITGDGDEIVFDFLLRSDAGDWRIVNIVTDGISDLALRRSEYTAIIRRQGFEGLLERLEAKIREHAQANG